MRRTQSSLLPPRGSRSDRLHHFALEHAFRDTLLVPTAPDERLGLTGRLIHHVRRTAVRNLERAFRDL